MAWAELAADRLDPTSSADVEWYSSLSLGGLSNYWTAAVPRFAPEDFTEGARLDERYRWPVTYDELVPFYDRAERALDGDRRRPDPRASRRTSTASDTACRPTGGRSPARPTRHGHGVGLMPMAKGRPWMVGPAGHRVQQLPLRGRAAADGRRFELPSPAPTPCASTGRPPPGRVESVEYVDARDRRAPVGPGPGRSWSPPGPIDSTAAAAALRRRPTSRAASATRSGLVGRYLHDHPREWWPADVGRAGAPPSPTPSTSPAPPDDDQRAAHGDVAHPRPRRPGTTPADLLPGHGRRRSGCRSSARWSRRRTWAYSLADGRAAIDRGPAITSRYDAPTRRQPRSRRATGCATSSAPAGVDVIASPARSTSSARARRCTTAGRCACTRIPEFGVLDGWNRMHDVRNVVVVDSSCFTTGPEKNPTLTAMALAARASEILADDLLASRI